MATKNPYSSIIGGNAKFAGIDQGIDFTGAGPVYALDAGTITRKVDTGSGWPGTGALIVEKLTGGPAAGKSVYFSEDLTAAQGTAIVPNVTKGQTIAYATGSGSAPGIETGWATDAGLPTAPLPPARPASQFTTQGADFLHFVSGQGVFSPSGGVVGGTPNANAGLGGLASGIASGVGGAITSAPITAATGGLNQLLGAGGAGSGIAKWLGIPTLPKNPIQRGAEMVAGGVLVLLGFGIIGLSAISKVAAPVTPVAKVTRRGVGAARRQAPANRQARATAKASPYKSSRKGGAEPRTRPGFEGVGRAPRKAQPTAKRTGEGIPF